jgi:hypothetical protein
MPTVNVTVNVTFDRKGSTVSITVDPEPLDLSTVVDDVDIEWSLTGPADFDSGIHIKGAGGKFSPGTKTAKKHKWKKNGAHNGKTYEYRIGIVDTTDPMNPITYELDPTIRN